MEASHRTPCWDGLPEHIDELRAYLTPRVRDEHELEDIVQEALIRAARYRTRLEHPERLRFWLLRIARNVLNDWLHRELRFTRHGDELLELQEGREGEPGEDELDPEVSVEGGTLQQSEVIADMRRALEEMSGGDRELLREYYSGPGCCRTTGFACGVDPRLVKVRLFRARKRLAGRLRLKVAQRVQHDRRLSG